jgi:hypothetical protein
VPIIDNLPNNGGLDTGLRTNIVTVLGGTSNGRFTNAVPIAIPDANGRQVNVTQLRTVLNNIAQDAFAAVAREIPNYRISIGSCGTVSIFAGDNRTEGSRTRNHPNGVAIDTNATHNGQTEPARRQEPGINAVPGFQHINSLDMELIMERHGLRLGYRGDREGLTHDGFMHWSVSRT